MAFNNYLEDENDKPYFTTNSLGYYYDKMEGFAEKVEQAAKILNVTKEEVEKNITAYIEQNKNELDQRLAQWDGKLEQNKTELDQRLAQWDGKLETFDSSVETLLSEWVDNGTLNHVIDSTLIDQKIAPVTTQLAETGDKIAIKSDIVMVGDSLVKADDISGISIPLWLTQLLRKEVVNKGVFGNWLSDVLDRLEEDVISLQPKTCIILAGTNPINDRSQSLNTLIMQATEIADRLMVHNIEPIFVSVPPRGDFPDLNKTIRSFNSMLSAMCELKQLGFVDIYSKVCEPDGNPIPGMLSNDNLHWANYGAFTAAQTIADTFPKLQNYDDKKMLVVDTLYDNYLFNLSPVVDDDGSTGLYWDKIKTDTATFSIEDNPLGGKLQVIQKPVTATYASAGIKQLCGGYLAGKKYRTAIDFEFETTEQPDGDTFFRMFLIAQSNGADIGTYGKTYYMTTLGKIKCRLYLDHLMPNADRMRFEIHGLGKTAFTLKVGRIWAEEII